MAPSQDAPDGGVTPDDHENLAVVVVNFHTAALVVGLMAALPDWARPIVVDNSVDETEAARLRASGAEVVVSAENRGFAAGVNVGAAAISGSPWVFLLNPDATIDPENLGRLWAGARSADLDVSSPAIVNPVNHSTWYDGGHMNERLFVPVHEGFNRPHADRPAAPPRLTGFVSGCMMLLSPRAVDALLPMREDLFMYWEDVELCLRARQLGLRCGVVPSAQGQHPKGDDQSRGYHYYRMRNRLVVARADGSKSWGMVAAMTPLVLVKEAREISRASSGRTRKLAAACRGALAGLRQQRGRAPGY